MSMPSSSSKKYTSALSMVFADGQVSSAHCCPVSGQVPHRGFTVSLDEGGSMPSLTAETLSQEEVYDADAAADVARLAGGWTPPRLKIFTSVRPVLAPEALV